MTDAVPEVAQVPEVKKDEVKKDEVKLNEYEFRVEMACGGCSGAVTRALTKYNGGGHVEVLEAEPKTNTVRVRSALTCEVVRDIIAKTGKKVLETVEKPKVREVVANKLVGETGKKALETAEKPKVGEVVAKNLVGETAKQAPGPSPAA
ncbi:hypothetical protein H4R27_001459 [Coemansia aciculifera]|nr:hypothetical protein H4R27_001459 [Coemansia aciculifera]